MAFPFRHFWALLAVLLAPLSARAHPVHVPVQFSITNNVGYGNDVFVSGSAQDLTGGGILLYGVKLVWNTGNVWTGSIGLPAGSQVTYTYLSHASDNVGYLTGSGTAISTAQTVTVPSAPGPPYLGKTIILTSTFASAYLLYQDISTNGSWTTLPMYRTGQGRTASESIFEVDNVAQSGDWIQFVFHDANSNYINAPAPPYGISQTGSQNIPTPYQSLSAPYNFETYLDVLQVQDQQVYNYAPPSTVSSSTISNVFVNSTATGIPSRYIHIYLPRGYAQNTWKSYPVLYFHDGQNVFFPNGTYGWTWDADRVANYEISMGRMREAIIVAVDNGNGYGSDRAYEFVPPGDQIAGSNPGIANEYESFLINNVVPTLNYNYRTLNPPGQATDPTQNLVAGSSLGGLVNGYIAVTGSTTFGKIGIFSPAFWAAPNFMGGAFAAAAFLPLRIYMDIGSNENAGGDSNTYWEGALNVYNQFLSKGYTVNSNLFFYPQPNAIHNEYWWSDRLPYFYQFALNLWDEPNTLALAKFPPALQLLSADPVGGSAQISYLAPLGITFTLQSSPDLFSWTNRATATPATNIWEDRTVNDTFAPGSKQLFWRIHN